MNLKDSNSSPTALVDMGKLTLDKVYEPAERTAPAESKVGATVMLLAPLISFVPKLASAVFKPKDMPDT